MVSKLALGEEPHGEVEVNVGSAARHERVEWAVASALELLEPPVADPVVLRDLLRESRARLCSITAPRS